jgi:hypothetical protein
MENGGEGNVDLEGSEFLVNDDVDSKSNPSKSQLTKSQITQKTCFHNP